MVIKSISFKFGGSPGAKPLSFEPPAVTVFVGPNNSGKSLVLRELSLMLNNEVSEPQTKIIDTVAFRPFGRVEAIAEVNRLDATPHAQETVHSGNMIVAHSTYRNQISRNGLLSALLDPEANRGFFIGRYLRFQTMGLDGQSRLTLANNAPSQNFLAPPNNPLDLLIRDNARRGELRRIVHDAFGRYLVMDTTQPSLLRLRFADREPTEDEERSFKEVAVTFHQKTEPLEEFSDGVRAFVGTLIQVIAGEPRILTMDEPEAFLHPALAFSLGKEICHLLAFSDRQFFAATHSPDFVMGCVAAGALVSIVRLTHDKQVSSARLLPHAEMKALMRKPMLRSTGALRGLFYSSVVVTEADADRAFYAEINERLLTFEPLRGIPNALFLNANGVDTIAEIVAPLRALGIPAAMIVDLDVVEKGGANWAKFMDACGVPEIERHALEVNRKSVRDALVTACPDYKRNGGIDVLSQADKEAASNFLSRLSEYGMFVVGRGEVEYWLSDLPLDRSKHKWLHGVFEKLGDTPESSEYVRPNSGDVWKFLFDLKGWLVDPAKKGVRD